MRLGAPCYLHDVDLRPVHDLQVGLAASLGVCALANVAARGCHLGKGLAHAIMALPASAAAVALGLLLLRAATAAGRKRIRQQAYGLGVLGIVLAALTIMTLPIWIMTGTCP